MGAFSSRRWQSGYLLDAWCTCKMGRMKDLSKQDKYHHSDRFECVLMAPLDLIPVLRTLQRLAHRIRVFVHVSLIQDDRLKCSCSHWPGISHLFAQRLPRLCGRYSHVEFCCCRGCQFKSCLEYTRLFACLQIWRIDRPAYWEQLQLIGISPTLGKGQVLGC